MAATLALLFSVDTEPMRQSLASLSAAIESSDCIRERLIEAGFCSLIFGDDLGGLFRCEAFDTPTAGAFEVHSLRVMPDERYVELVATVARDGNPYVARTVHGWPILSSVCGNPMIAEAGGASSASGGGLGR